MKLHRIETGNFKLDGGAMFGVVPKVMWNKRIDCDANNLCTWSMRCLLIEEGDRLILVDNGMGDKQDEKFFSHFHPHGEDNLTKSLQAKGFSVDDITDVFLTHLHFDHCGGSVKWKDSHRTKLEVAFKNAQYWSNKKHWDWAIEPNVREQASFLKENILPIQESGQLNFIEEGANNRTLNALPNMDVHFVNGHTEAQMLPIIHYKGKKLLFAADLIPSAHHIGMPWIMGYDMRPLETLKEKELLLNEAANNNWVLLFEHDANTHCASLKQTERGVRLNESFNFEELF